MALQSTGVRALAVCGKPPADDPYAIADARFLQEKNRASHSTSGRYVGGTSYDTHPASRSMRRWQRQAKVRRLIGAALTWPFRYLFGCRHPHPSRPYSNHQTCLDCGASRAYAYTSDGIFIGRWRSAVQG